MIRGIYKAISLFLAIAMLIMTLSACSSSGASSASNSQSSTSDAKVSQSASDTKTLAEELGYGYKTDYAVIPYNFDYVSTMLYCGGRIYLYGYINGYSANTSEQKLVSMSTDGSDIQEVTLPTFSDNSNIGSIAIDKQGNLYMDVREYFSDSSDSTDNNGTGALASEGDDITETYRLLKCDQSGRILAELDLNESLKDSENDYCQVNSLAVDDEGNIYIDLSGSEYASLYVMDNDMNGAYTIENFGNWIRSLSPYNGSILLCYYDMNNNLKYGIVDNAAKNLADVGIRLPDNISNYRIYTGVDGDTYLTDNSYLYKLNTATGELCKILNWVDSDICYSSTQSLLVISDELIYGDYYDGTLDTTEIMMLKKIPASEIPERILLTYACVWGTYQTIDAIISFNRTNEQYRITVNDYSIYNTADDNNLGYTRLTNDLLAGKIPDLLNLTNINTSSFVNKGLLLDLYTMIDSDPELGRNYFTEGFLEALESKDGKLYQMGTSFYFNTLIGQTSVVGSEPGWTIDEMITVYKSLPEDTQLLNWMTKESFISTFVMYSLDDYVDYASGQCYFDSDEFVNILQMASTFPDNSDYYYSDDDEYVSDSSLFRDGKLMLSEVSISGFDDLDYLYAYYYNQDVTIKGYPCKSGSGNRMTLENPIAITTASACPDGAFELIKMLVGDAIQSNRYTWAFPVQRDAFEKRMQAALEPEYYEDENGEMVEFVNTWTIDNVDIVVPTTTQEQVDMVRDMITSVDHLSSHQIEDVMMEIILDEADSFFSSQKTAEEVSKLIQNRISTYIMESI